MEGAAPPGFKDHEDHRKALEQGRDLANKRWLLANEIFGKQIGEHRLKFIEGVAAYGQSTVRYLFVLNGGAIIAVLTFIASIFTRNDDVGRKLVAGAEGAFPCFAVGLASAVAVSGVAYLNYNIVASSWGEPGDVRQYILKDQGWTVSRAKTWASGVTMGLAIALAAVSLGAFLLGAWRFLAALKSI